MTSNELEIFKQNILDDVRVMMQTTGQVTQYIGARYVPLFADPIDWDNQREYEPLTIVLYQGNSYTSRQFIPKGIDINNTDFWAITGNYNAQIEQYRKEVATLKKNTCKQLGTAADFKSSSAFSNGDIVITMGFNQIGDGGGAVYIISENGTGNGYDSITTKNGYANLVHNGFINIKQLGYTGIDDQTELVNYAVNHFVSVDFNGLLIPINRKINISNKVSLNNGTFKMMFSPTTLTYMFDSTKTISIANCNFICDTPSANNGAVQSSSDIKAENCNFNGFAYCITKPYDITHNVHTVIASNINSDNCRVVVHMSDCVAYISNINAHGAFTTELLSSVFYIRTDVKAFITNIVTTGYDGSTFHINRIEQNTAVPSYSKEEPHKSVVVVSDVQSDSPRLIDINSYADVYITNAIDVNEVRGRGTIEYRNGCGSISIYDSVVANVLITGNNPIPDIERKIFLSGCTVIDSIYDDINIQDSANVMVKTCELGTIYKRKGNIQVIASTFNQNNAIVLYGSDETHFINGCIKNKTGLLVNLTDSTKNNKVILTNNTVYSSNYVTDSGTTNTVKDNGNFSYA